THPRHTADILRRVRRFEAPARDAAAHHERPHGSGDPHALRAGEPRLPARVSAAGYPDGVRAVELSVPARILAVADVYEALTSDRPYRPALSVDAAISELRRDAGPRLHTAATDA